MTSPIRGTLHGSPSLAGVERLVLMRWMDKMCFYTISCSNCLHHTRYFFYIGTYRSYHPTFCTYMEDNVYRGLGCNAFASPSFFSWIRRRAAHLCIKKKKYGPLQTPPPHSGPSCEGLLKQEKRRNLKKKQIKVRPDQLHLAKN
jgi:hypothetical protein